MDRRRSSKTAAYHCYPRIGGCFDTVFSRPRPRLFGLSCEPRAAIRRTGLPIVAGTMMTETGTMTAIVTGAGSGIGRARAQRFLSAGWHFLAVDQHEEGLSLRALVNPSAGLPTLLATLQCDVTDAAAAAMIFDKCLREFGASHCLVNNAGKGGHSRHDRRPMMTGTHRSISNWAACSGCQA
ncbi:hypothetical protein ABIB57_000915 [Devosia sp. UYZn731]